MVQIRSHATHLLRLALIVCVSAHTIDITTPIVDRFWCGASERIRTRDKLNFKVAELCRNASIQILISSFFLLRKRSGLTKTSIMCCLCPLNYRTFETFSLPLPNFGCYATVPLIAGSHHQSLPCSIALFPSHYRAYKIGYTRTRTVFIRLCW